MPRPLVSLWFNAPLAFKDGKFAALLTPNCAACTRALAHAWRVCGLLHNARSTTSDKVKGAEGEAGKSQGTDTTV